MCLFVQVCKMTSKYIMSKNIIFYYISNLNVDVLRIRIVLIYNLRREKLNFSHKQNTYI